MPCIAIECNKNLYIIQNKKINIKMQHTKSWTKFLCPQRGQVGKGAFPNAQMGNGCEDKANFGNSARFDWWRLGGHGEFSSWQQDNTTFVSCNTVEMQFFPSVKFRYFEKVTSGWSNLPLVRAKFKHCYFIAVDSTVTENPLQSKLFAEDRKLPIQYLHRISSREVLIR